MYISIDAGGTNTRVASAIELERPIPIINSLRRENTHIYDNDLRFMIDSALELAGGRAIDAVGMGMPGALNDDRSGLRYSKNLSSWAGKPLAPSISDALGACPVILEDDVTTAGLGEAYYGDHKTDFDYVIWGTGIGGGSVQIDNTRPDVTTLNWHNYYSEWENSVGGGELVNRFGKSPLELTDSDWDLISDEFTGHLSNYIYERRPEKIVFAGGLAVRNAKLIQQANQMFHPDIEVSKFGNDSGLIGGFGLIKHKITS